MDGKSRDIKQEQIEKLKQLFPEAVPEGKNTHKTLQKTRKLPGVTAVIVDSNRHCMYNYKELIKNICPSPDMPQGLGWGYFFIGVN